MNNDELLVGVKYDSSKPEMMRRVAREWRSKTNASIAVQRDILYQWFMLCGDLMVEEDFLANLKKELGE